LFGGSLKSRRCVCVVDDDDGGESAAMICCVWLMSHGTPLVITTPISPNSKSVPKVRDILPQPARRQEHTEKNLKKPEKDFKKFSFGGVCIFGPSLVNGYNRFEVGNIHNFLLRVLERCLFLRTSN
jgi:hypothetical protein